MVEQAKRKDRESAPYTVHIDRVITDCTERVGPTQNVNVHNHA